MLADPDFKDLIQKSRSVSSLRPIPAKFNKEVAEFDSYCKLVVNYFS